MERRGKERTSPAIAVFYTWMWLSQSGLAVIGRLTLLKPTFEEERRLSSVSPQVADYAAHFAL
jgi:hypothetical protein